jgi:hypothetical protein
VHPDPDRLLEVAEALYDKHKDETDLRQAVSAAYYALFHYTLRAAADLVIGAANRNIPRYNLAYCSIDHKRLKILRDQLRGKAPNEVVLPYAPPGGFGQIAVFARLVVNLQEERHRADYHPIARFDEARTLQAISNARDAIRHFEAASVEQRESFLTLLLFVPRQP